MLEPLFLKRMHISNGNMQKGKKPCTMTSVLVHGSIKCGNPNESNADCEGYIEIPTSLIGQGDFFVLRAKGDSMLNAGIHNGDLLLVRYQSYADNGNVVVAEIDNEFTLKTFYKNDAERLIILHPENQNYKDIVVKSCRIIGVAEKIIKSIKENH